MRVEVRRLLFLAGHMRETDSIQLADLKTRLGHDLQKRWLVKILKDNYDCELPIIPEFCSDDEEPRSTLN